MNKGILAGGVENGTFIAIPSFKCGNSGSTFELNNGSMIKAEIMDIPNVTFKAAGTRSLIKSTKSISTGWTTKFNGNLDIECPEGEFAKGVPANNPNYIMENSVELYIPNGSKTIITSCGELSEIPDPTPDPEDPEFPIEVEDNKDYTYLFEDQWPLYGDYDMNDVVVRYNYGSTFDEKNLIYSESFTFKTFQNIASNQNGLAFRLKTEGNIESTTYSIRQQGEKEFTETTFEYEPQDNVYLLTTNVKENMGTEYKVTVNYSKPISKQSEAQAFIFKNDEDGLRWEVHIPPVSYTHLTLPTIA